MVSSMLLPFWCGRREVTISGNLAPTTACLTSEQILCNAHDCPDSEEYWMTRRHGDISYTRWYHLQRLGGTSIVRHRFSSSQLLCLLRLLTTYARLLPPLVTATGPSMRHQRNELTIRLLLDQGIQTLIFVICAH